MKYSKDFATRRLRPALNLAQFTAAFGLSLFVPCQPMRLRYRSAAFTVARWDFISILLFAKRVKSFFKRAGDGFFARLGKSCSNTQSCLNDFPF
ncbi:hypothetical protein [uncultured Rikenella sp.]|uniref:hypothetical protein n=1 Tax=uncultured Rikenella sp. TaxID=368003 RepID=UPI0025F5282E|nr:hypothetical protein [uncultured Rikenella sp.]